MTDDLDELGAALAAFQAEMPTVHRGQTATVRMKEGGSYSYTYADLADVAAAAMPLLTKHGLSFITYPGNGVLHGMLLHSSGQRIVSEGGLPVTGGSPQQIGSALTYMRRYLLGCMTGIVTDDDDDGQHAAQPQPVKSATDEQTRQIAMLASDIGIDREAKLDGVAKVIGRRVDSTSELTEAEAAHVIASMRERLSMQKAGE